MALTQTQYEYLATDELKKGIIKTIIKESPIIARLPFIEITGNSYMYNWESAEATAQWVTVNETITEATPTFVQRSVALANLIGDADVDQFMKQTRTNVQDLQAAIIELKAKNMAYEFEKQFIYGGTTTTAPTYCFDGLLKLIAEKDSTDTTSATDLNPTDNTQVVDNTALASESAGLSLAKLDELIDATRPGVPDALMMSRLMRRDVNALARTTGAVLRETHDEFGRFIQHYNGIPILINDFIADNMDDPSSGIADIGSYVYSQASGGSDDMSFIFALKFGENALHGVQNGGIQTSNLGALETKDAERIRIKWYCGIALPGIRSCAVLINANDD